MKYMNARNGTRRRFTRAIARALRASDIADGHHTWIYSAVMRRWIILSALLVTATTTVPAQTVPPLRVYWIDVEGGAATLIVTPAGESVLVDAGNPGARDPGRIARTAKEVARVQRIDYMVVTHLHIDHFGGVADLAGLIPIGTLY